MPQRHRCTTLAQPMDGFADMRAILRVTRSIQMS